VNGHLEKMTSMATMSRTELLEIVANADGVWTATEEEASTHLVAEMQVMIDARHPVIDLT
jgi:hypothetical protein